MHACRSLFVGFFGLLALAATGEASQAYRDYAVAIVASPPPGVAVRPDIEALLDQLANEARSAKGSPLLTAKAQFKTAARAQAIDMVLGDFVGHRSLKGYSFNARISAFAEDISRVPRRGENAARERSKGPPDAQKARRLFQQWMKSGGHKRNMLNRSYTAVSTGVVQKGDHLYAVQIFFSEREDSAGSGLGGFLSD
jgi:uncharacterized protein YkwD